MRWTRRRFLTAGLGAGALARARAAAPQAYFGLHPLIEANSKAVFIRRTRVAEKMDAEAKRAAGLQLAREIFVPLDEPGLPLETRIVLKPNMTSVRNQRPDLENWGTGTDPDFYEGLLLALEELGLSRFQCLEANSFDTWNNYRGFLEINARHGVEMNQPARSEQQFAEGYELTWSQPPEPVVFQRIPHYAPVNQPDTWLLNIAKWKAHGMCLTLAVKNVQGLVVAPYVRFCSGWTTVTGVPGYIQPDICPDAEPRLRQLFERHLSMGYSRYDSKASLSPLHQEIWAQKTCDNLSVLKTGLAMIEGIYARDGDGFGEGDDYQTNLVMFSKDPFRLDLVGLWLGGHEPGNVHLCRIAKERGLTDTFNPWEVPVFEWLDGEAVPRALTDFPRTPLKTYYLQKDGEPRYHLVDEPFDYDRIKD